MLIIIIKPVLVLSHKDLNVYKISFLLLNEIYKIAKLFPNEEKYGLCTQIKRAAVSVCSNIAEGAAMFSKKEKRKFYRIARGSVVEIDTQIEIALQQQFINNIQIVELSKYLESVFSILSKMISNLSSP